MSFVLVHEMWELCVIFRQEIEEREHDLPLHLSESSVIMEMSIEMNSISSVFEC